MKSLSTSFVIVAAIVAYIATSSFAAPLADFEERYTPSHQHPYRLYVPKNYDPNKSYPVLTYYHSSGQSSAASTVRHPNVTDCYNWATDPDHEAFIFVPFVMSVDTMVEVLDTLSGEFNIDRTRVYTTGWSLGAIYSFQAVGNEPTHFAAAAPMAGWTTNPASAYVDSAIWAFNGSSDGTTPPSGVLPTFQEAWDLGSTVLYTEVVGGTHSSTPRTGYAEPGLFPWMFAQSTTKAHDLSMFIGWDKTAIETKTLVGPGQSTSRTDQYFVGYYGQGDLNLVGGATFDSADGYVAVDGRSKGKVNISGQGSQWNADGDFYVGYRGGADATVMVADQGELNVTEKLVVIPGADLELKGGNITASTMSLDGFLHVDLEALQQPGAGKIDIEGYAKMNGVLDVELPDDISSIVGKKTIIATFASHSDNMRDLDITELENDLILAPSLAPTELAVTVTYKGDANLDGKVSLIDLDILGRNWHQSCTGKIICGDFNGNGTVSQSDLDILGQNWRKGSVVMNPMTSSIPEPASVALLISAAVMCIGRRR